MQFLNMLEARSRPGCQGPQQEYAGMLCTTSWKMKLTGRRREDEEGEVKGDVETIRETHNNAHETWHGWDE